MQEDTQRKWSQRNPVGWTWTCFSQALSPRGESLLVSIMHTGIHKLSSACTITNTELKSEINLFDAATYTHYVVQRMRQLWSSVGEVTGVWLQGLLSDLVSCWVKDYNCSCVFSGAHISTGTIKYPINEVIRGMHRSCIGKLNHTNCNHPHKHMQIS